jgi:mRNA interferase MazF
VLVVSSNRFNRSRIATVLAATVTSNLRLAAAPGNVALDETASGLPRPSVVNVSQLVTLDRRRLEQRVSRLGAHEQALVDAGLRLVLDLSG